MEEREGSPSIPKEEDETVTLRRGEEGMEYELLQPRKYIQHRVSLSNIWNCFEFLPKLQNIRSLSQKYGVVQNYSMFHPILALALSYAWAMVLGGSGATTDADAAVARFVCLSERAPFSVSPSNDHGTRGSGICHS